MTAEIDHEDLLGAKAEIAALTGTTLTDIDDAVMELTGGERDTDSQASAIAELVRLTNPVPAELLPDGLAAWPESEGQLPLALTGGPVDDGEPLELTSGQYAALTVAQCVEDEVDRYSLMLSGEQPGARYGHDDVDHYLAGIHARGRALGMGAVTAKILSPDVIALTGPQLGANETGLGANHSADCHPSCDLYHDDAGSNPDDLDAADAQAEIDRITSTYKGIFGGPYPETPYGANQSDSPWVREADRSYSPARPIL